MFRSRVVHALAVVALLVTGGFGLGDRALAIQDSEDKVWFGPIGVGVGQGARLNVYVTGDPNETPWEFAVQIFNRRGEVVQERQFRVASGAIASFEVNIGNPDTFPADRLGRRTLRAEIVGFNPQPDPPGKYGATFEVYSLLTGHTSILIGNADVLPAALTFPGTGAR
jgi:hypothetical protein